MNAERVFLGVGLVSSTLFALAGRNVESDYEEGNIDGEYLSALSDLMDNECGMWVLDFNKVSISGILEFECLDYRHPTDEELVKYNVGGCDSLRELWEKEDGCWRTDD